MVGPVRLVRQAKTIRGAVESDAEVLAEVREFESSAEFPYLVFSSHALLVSSAVGALKKKNDPISLIFF